MSAIKQSWNAASEYLSLMVRRPTPLQYAALCYRRKKGVVEILLITSRGTGRWILPKGWAMKKESEPGTAAQEAYEEAGVVGQIDPTALGTFEFDKWVHGMPVPCTVQVYPLKVERLDDDFPEKDQRQRKWFSIEEAAAKVDEPQLQDLIKSFCP